MSLYVLDTDILSLYRRGHAQVRRRVEADPAPNLAITVMTIEEQLSGWYTMLRQAKDTSELARAYQELADATQYLGGKPILSFTKAAITRYDQLVTLKLQIRKMDLRIAAITLEYGGILITRNRRDFQKIPNLVMEDWSV